MTPTAQQSARRFREFLTRRVERSPRAGPMVLAAIVGLGAGLAAVGFSTLVELSDHFFLDIVKDEWLGGLPDARLILIPAIGGLLVGPITYLLAALRSLVSEGWEPAVLLRGVAAVLGVGVVSIGLALAALRSRATRR